VKPNFLINDSRSGDTSVVPFSYCSILSLGLNIVSDIKITLIITYSLKKLCYIFTNIIKEL